MKTNDRFRFKLIILACFLAYTGFVIYTQQVNIGKLMAEQETLARQYEQVQTNLNRLQHRAIYGYPAVRGGHGAQQLGLVYDELYSR